MVVIYLLLMHLIKIKMSFIVIFKNLVDAKML